MCSSMCYVVSELPNHIKMLIGSPHLSQIHHREFLVLQSYAQAVIDSMPGAYVNKIRVPLDHYEFDENYVIDKFQDGITDSVSSNPQFVD